MSNPVAEAKAAVRALLYLSGVSTLVARARRQPRIFMLHGIGGSTFDEDAFDHAIAYLKRNFRVIPFDQLIGEIADPHSSGAPAVALTFDDGLQNHVTVAYPVLARHGVPATFFVCPGLIDAGQWLWPHEVRARLSMLDDAQRRDIAAGCGPAVPPDIEAMVESLKRMTCKERAGHLAAIRGRTAQFAASPGQAREYDLATWQQLRQLDPALITVGSHSWSHDIMIGMDAAQLHTEVVDSKSRIEAMLDRQVDYFCYPNGDFDDATVAAVRSAYAAAVSTRAGAIGEPAPPLYELPRISMSETLPAIALQMARE